ncbi:MAG: hypothetical protein CMJ35_00750 [Phycisphaerae bacterium]|nr:hypothetical protein [Phycisphaerae bacterium]MBM90129.1 hypothetical protein [Phycisphaerae bacterium]HCT46821.1 hypothetical protein [Phycisphaerales bacterium]
MRYLIPLTLALSAGTAAASTPTLGGPMSHLLVTLFQNQVYLTFESPAMSTVSMQGNEGDFVGDASLLNNMGYNAQFGWLANGFISLPPDSGIFMRTLSSSPHLNVYEESTFNPIFGTDGSDDVWQWDGTMTHNWYSTETHGSHWARYEVFVGDLFGNPLDGYTSASIDLTFEYGPDLSGRIGVKNSPSIGALPTPGVMSTLGIGIVAAGRRRRS